MYSSLLERLCVGLVHVLLLAIPGLASATQPPVDDAMPGSADAELIPPRMVTATEVTYPASLATAEAPPAGEVVIRYTVSPSGEVVMAEVSKRVHPRLDALALEAVLLAQHEPGTFRGQPVEVTTAAVFRFEPPPPPQSDPPAASIDAPPATEVSPQISSGSGSGPVRIRGELLEGGRRQPVANASVIAMPAGGLPVGRVSARASRAFRDTRSTPTWTAMATTDAEGKFALTGVRDGRVLVVFVVEGFERLEHVVELRRGTVVDGRYYATRMQTHPYRTVVATTPEPPTEVVSRIATPAESGRAPGSRGDALVGLQNFPGMARTPFGIGTLVIRGAAPGDSAVYLGGHEIPQLFHFGGLKSVFTSELVEQFAYVPSNFDAKFGDATGGLVEITPRAPKRDGVHGYANLDLVDASALVEAGVGKGGAAVAARRSHLDLALRAFDGVTVAPRYWDYQGLFQYPVGAGTIDVRVFGSDDKLVALSELGEGFELASSMHRVDFAYRRRFGRWSLLASPAFIYDSSASFGNETRNYAASVRVETRWRQSDRFGLVLGTESRFGASRVDLQLPPATTPGAPFMDDGASTARSNTTIPFAVPAVYGTGNLRLGAKRPVTISPGIRLTGYATPMQAFTADPRVNVSWAVGPRWTLKAGSGLYSQAPALLELDETFGNPDLAPEKSWQSSAGFAVLLPRDVSIELTGFYKVLWDLAAVSDDTVVRDGAQVAERYASTGRGRSYGAEIMVRRDFAKRLYGWIAYTLSRTEIRERHDQPFALALFDQTHILTLVGGYKLPRNWSIGTRFRLTSGLPTTPQANAIFDAGTGTWTAFAAPTLSDRLPLFHQLDLRVDKTWTLRLVRLLLYLDIQNLYNARNAEFVAYSYDSRESARITSLTILPTLGFRIDW